MLGVIRVLNLSAASKTVFYMRRQSEPVSSRQGNESVYVCFFINCFLAGFAGFPGFLVGDAPECRLQLYFSSSWS